MLLKDHNLHEFEDFRINLLEQTLWFEDERIPLAPKVFETLLVLIENQGRLMTKDELMDEIWRDTFVEERNLTQNIFTLRKIFKEKKRNAQFIETIPRRGYRFIAELKPVEISLEETLSVNHKKQMHITAEGFVSKTKLSNTVEKIARDLISSENSTRIEPKQLESADSRNSSTFLTRWFLLSTVLILLFLGVGFWAWQNDFLNSNKSAFTSDYEKQRPLLEFERLTDSGDAFFPAISPGKQFLAYVINEDSKFSIRLKHLATGSITEVVPPQNYELRSPQFSRDGNYLYYASTFRKNFGNTIFQIPLFGGTSRKITDGVAQNFTISPDGSQLAFFQLDLENRRTHLIICQTDGSDKKFLSTLESQTPFAVWGTFPSWSPDGKKIVATVRDNSADETKTPGKYFVEVNLSDGTVNKLKTPPWNTAYQAHWLADGSGLITLALDKPNDYSKLYHLSYPGGEARQLTIDTNNYTWFRLSDDSEMIVATEEKNPYNLELIPVEDPHNTRRLTDSAAIRYGIRGLDWTPDGKELVFLKFEGLIAANIWKMDLETLEQKQLTFDEGIKNFYPQVTPDGNSIIFSSNRTGKWHIWQMDIEGSNMRQITDSEGGDGYPQVSSDGKWLVYSTPATLPDKLWKRPLPGGQAKLLLKGAAGISDISPDMKYIVAHYFDLKEKEDDPYKYVLLPFEAGHEPKETGISTQNHVLEWKLDNSGIYYLNRGQSHTNIWFYSLADETKLPVTDYDSQEIVNLSISPDGKTIAAARGKITSNVFKITGFRP